MAIVDNIHKTFKLGTTIELVVTFKDFDDNLVDPTTVSAAIRDADFNLVETLSPQKVSTGVYIAYYTVDTDTFLAELLADPSEYIELMYEWEATVGGLKSVDRKVINIILAD